MRFSLASEDSVPRVVQTLVIINVAIFLVDMLTGGRYITAWLSLWTWGVIHFHQWWRVATYMFLHDHSGPIHILLNMYGLWMFGAPVAFTMGEKRFLRFYLATGLFSGACTLAFYWYTGNPSAVVGASGALFGVLYAFARYFPTARLLVFFVFPLEARYAVILFGVVEVLSISNRGSIAHITHVGGVLFAWLYFQLEARGVFSGKLLGNDHGG